MSLDSLNWQLKRLGNGVWAMALLGNIKSGTLPNLLRALSLRRATATLVCEQTPQIRATVHMIDGKLRRVTLGDLYGEPALSQLFRWKEGYYYLIKGRIEEIKEEVEEENKVSIDLTHDSNQHLFNIQKFIG